jgi:hypothetical protein
MHWLRIAFIGALVGCGDDDDSTDDTGTTLTAPTTTPGTSDAGDVGDAGGTTDTSAGDSTSGTTVLTNVTSAEDESTLSGAEVSSGDGGVDCTAPADCAECWTCATQGPCMAAYQSCQSMFNCIPALICVESMCTADGLQQECASTCCNSCEDLMTCPMVDAVISCIEQQCAGSCGDVTCP